MGRLVEEELSRRDLAEARIPIGLWPEVADLLTDLDEMASQLLERIHDVMGVLGDDVIEVDAVEVEQIFELPEGNIGKS